MIIDEQLPYRWVDQKNRTYSSSTDSVLSSDFFEIIDVLIPAHNEEENLEKTVRFIRSAFLNAKRVCRIIIGVDNSQDETTKIAEAHGDLVLIMNYQSKWKTLNALSLQASSTWIALVDVGAIWPNNLIRIFQIYEQDQNLLYFAPGYAQEKASFFHNLNWALEAKLKVLENNLGGTIAVHGATVFYRRDQLIETLADLQNQIWLNDDIIIPLLMRMKNPEMHGLYLHKLQVIDTSQIQDSAERRNRMTAGNLQVSLFMEKNKKHIPPKIKILWARRYVRIFWSYLLILICLLIIVLIPVNIYIQLSTLALLTQVGCKNAAFRASILAPYQLYLIKKSQLETKTTSKENLSTPIIDDDFVRKIKWN